MTPIHPKFFSELNKCRVDLYLQRENANTFYSGQFDFDYITSIWIEPNIENEKDAKAAICEATRQTLYNPKKSTANNEVTYDYNYCLISVREYPVKDKLIINNPMIISDWQTHKGE